MVSGNFWSNLQMDLKTGHFIEKGAITPDKRVTLPHDRSTMDGGSSSGRSCRFGYYLAYSKGFIRDLDREKVTRLAELLDFPFVWGLLGSEAPASPRESSETPMQVQVKALLNRYGQRASIFILDKARSFARQYNKKLLIVLNNTTPFGDNTRRDDQEILDYLVKENFDYVDINQSYRDDFRNSRSSMSFRDYMKQYLVKGDQHPNPKGNHFVAYALKDKVVSMFDLKPIPYQSLMYKAITFAGYLRGGGYK